MERMQPIINPHIKVLEDLMEKDGLLLYDATDEVKSYIPKDSPNIDDLYKEIDEAAEQIWKKIKKPRD